MTNRDFLKAIINSNIAQEYKDHAQAELSKLDAKNEKRKNTLTKAQRENEVTKTAILNLLTSEGAKVASAIGENLGITTQKASSLCTLLVKDGKVAVADIKVKGKGTVKQYTAIATEDEDGGEG